MKFKKSDYSKNLRNNIKRRETLCRSSLLSQICNNHYYSARMSHSQSQSNFNKKKLVQQILLKMDK